MGWGLVALVVVGVVVVLVLRQRAVARADASIARHRAEFERDASAVAKRPRVRLPILEPAHEEPAEDLVERVAKLIRAVPLDDRRRLSGLDGDESSPEAIDAILSAHPEPLAALEPLPRATSAVVPRVGDVAALDSDGERVTRFQEVARWCDVATQRAIARRDDSAAAGLVARTLVLAVDVQQRGSLLARLVGVGIERRALGRLAELLGGFPMSDADRALLVRVIDRLESARPPLHEVADLERIAFQGLWGAVGAEADTLAVSGWRHLWSSRVLIATALDEGVTAIRELHADVGHRDRGQLAALAAAERLDARVGNPIARMVVFVWPFILRREIAAVAKRRACRTALAVAEFASAKARAPSTLDELVPGFLPAVPVDPCSDRQLHYAASPAPRVWSVGLDRRDDGGVPHAAPDTEDEPDQPGDIVVTLGGT